MTKSPLHHSNFPKVNYFVLDENTLCYQQNGMTDLGILHASVLKGSPYGRLDGTCPMPLQNEAGRLRKATLQDFHDFRVSSEGHDLS